MVYAVTLVAQRDIEDIVWTIWQENPGAADQVEKRLYEAFGLLARNPRLGHPRPELTDRPVLFLADQANAVRRNLQEHLTDRDREG